MQAMPYTEEIAARCSRLPADAPEIPADWLARQVGAGRATLWPVVDAAGAQVGFVAVRRDEESKELRCLAAAADHTVGLTPRIFAALEPLARSEGLGSICFSTIRPGLVLLAQKHGYRVREVFMGKDIQ